METFSQNQNATPTHPQKKMGKMFSIFADFIPSIFFLLSPA